MAAVCTRLGGARQAGGRTGCSSRANLAHARLLAIRASRSWSRSSAAAQSPRRRAAHGCHSAAQRDAGARDASGRGARAAARRLSSRPASDISPRRTLPNERSSSCAAPCDRVAPCRYSEMHSCNASTPSLLRKSCRLHLLLSSAQPSHPYVPPPLYYGLLPPGGAPVTRGATPQDQPRRAPADAEAPGRAAGVSTCRAPLDRVSAFPGCTTNECGAGLRTRDSGPNTPSV